MNSIEKAEQTMIENILKNTGKPLEVWIEIVKKTGLQKHGEIVKFLKTEHGFSHGFANMVAHKSKGSDAGSSGGPQELIEKQYEKKESLRPIYEKILNIVQQFGTDVEISPKNAYVSLRRKRQFALIQPTTKTRLDIGLTLKGRNPEGRLEPSGSFSAMCTHRIRTENPNDVDREVTNWLREAYDQAG